MLTSIACALFVATLIISQSGCSTVTEMSTTIGQAAGVITPQQAESINRSARAVEKSFEDITPEQEYYIGRSVAATILNTYSVYDEPAANHYLNVMGQTLAMASDKPETFGGYHFVILDSDEINAFAAPGGLIMVSRGMIRLCDNEDELAAVLAHEVGHVENQHGLRAIRKGRLTSALTILALEAGKNLGGNDLAQVTQAFEGSISDITGTMMNSGYSRKTEFQADQSAVKIMERVGYDPVELEEMLHEMKKNLTPGGHDFAKTHPDPDIRIQAIEKTISKEPIASPENEARKLRFDQFISGI